jgi:hypothetical protein
MKAARISQFGSLDVITVTETECPAPGPNEGSGRRAMGCPRARREEWNTAIFASDIGFRYFRYRAVGRLRG